MISIITSSISQEQCELFKSNIQQTIGNVPYELLIHDNRETHWGLCKLYNYYATKSQFDILCFLHEDIIFHTYNWGEIIIDFFNNTPQAGVLGFAGTTLKTKTLSNWYTSRSTTRQCMIQLLPDKTKKNQQFNPDKELYSPVALLDGLALITTKKIWSKYPFDEDLFRGFHLYDLDFSMQIAQHYTNYVCHTILVEHLSSGSFSKEWYNESLKFHKKWDKMLPFYVHPYSKKIIQRCEDFTSYQLVKGILKYSWNQRSIPSIIKERLFTKTTNLNHHKYSFKLIRHLFLGFRKRNSLPNK